jgi:hypothetical protein
MYIGDGTTYTSSAFTPADILSWHQYTTVYNAQRITFYIDGQRVSQSNVTSIILNPGNSPLYIGSDGLLGSRYLNGLIDEVRVYKKSLSASEVLRLYAEGSGRPNFASLHP